MSEQFEGPNFDLAFQMDGAVLTYDVAPWLEGDADEIVTNTCADGVTAVREGRATTVAFHLPHGQWANSFETHMKKRYPEIPFRCLTGAISAR